MYILRVGQGKWHDLGEIWTEGPGQCGARRVWRNVTSRCVNSSHAMQRHESRAITMWRPFHGPPTNTWSWAEGLALAAESTAGQWAEPVPGYEPRDALFHGDSDFADEFQDAFATTGQWF